MLSETQRAILRDMVEEDDPILWIADQYTLAGDFTRTYAPQDVHALSAAGLIEATQVFADPYPAATYTLTPAGAAEASK